MLASVAQIFATNKVSIETVRQSGRGNSAELIVMTHSADEGSLGKTVKELAKSEVVKSVESVLRLKDCVNESLQKAGRAPMAWRN